MDHDMASTVSRHVDACLHHLMDELDLRALLALTHPHAAPGQPALDLVMSILAERTDLNWPWLHSAFPSARAALTALAALHGALARLSPWTAHGIEDAVTAAAAEVRGGTRQRIEDLLRFAIHQHVSPLPFAEVMQIMGQKRCLARIKRVEAAFRRAQTIG